MSTLAITLRGSAASSRRTCSVVSNWIAGKPAAARAFDIARQVVDEHGFGEIELEAFAQVLVDRGLRLQQLDGRGHDDAVEQLEEIVAAGEVREDRCRHVRQAVELEPRALAQLAQQRHRGLDRR